MNKIPAVSKIPVFVVGFPKSGNTWLARLLAEATLSNIEAMNIVDASDNSAERDGIYSINKIHDTSKIVPPEEAPIVYVIRDVRDVLVSAFFFNNSFISEDWVRNDSETGLLLRLFCRAYFRHQLKRMNKCWCGNEFTVLMNWVYGNRNNLGSWSEHILSWTENKNIVVVKYEDLLEDTRGQLGKILEALDMDVNDRLLDQAISNQSFAKKKERFKQSGDFKNTRFLRSGKAGGYKDYLPPDMIKLIEQTHAKVLSRYGYRLEYSELQ